MENERITDYAELPHGFTPDNDHGYKKEISCLDRSYAHKSFHLHLHRLPVYPLPVNPAPHPRRDAGFTLLEILIALLILIVSLVSVFALFGAASASHRRAVASQNSAQLAYTVLAELEQVPNPGVLTNLVGKTHSSFDGYTYDVTFKQVGMNEIEAVVTIHWKKAGKDQSENYTTILLKR